MVSVQYVLDSVHQHLWGKSERIALLERGWELSFDSWQYLPDVLLSWLSPLLLSQSSRCFPGGEGYSVGFTLGVITPSSVFHGRSCLWYRQQWPTESSPTLRPQTPPAQVFALGAAKASALLAFTCQVLRESSWPRRPKRPPSSAWRLPSGGHQRGLRLPPRQARMTSWPHLPASPCPQPLSGCTRNSFRGGSWRPLGQGPRTRCVLWSIHD